jgi:hypothetical protein
MKTLVINLISRPDRFLLFQKAWDWMEPIERVEGVLSDIPHTGCGLAHVAAIRKGLESHDACLVLEDDARLNCSRETLVNIISTVKYYKNKYDAVILGPVFDSNNPCEPKVVYRVSNTFMSCSSTKSIESASAVVWFRRCLPLIDIYEGLLKKGYIFPIDRMLTTFSWTASDTVGWHKKFDIIYPFVKLPVSPRVLIANKCFIYQEPGLLSDNTREKSGDYLKASEEFLRRIYGDKALGNNV